MLAKYVDLDPGRVVVWCDDRRWLVSVVRGRGLNLLGIPSELSLKLLFGAMVFCVLVILKSDRVRVWTGMMISLLLNCVA